MNKNAQFDFFNLITLDPGALSLIIKAPLSNREANLLYRLWKTCDRDDSGRLRLADNIDSSDMSTLRNKGIIVGYGHPGTVEISKKGKEIINQIILHAEKSAFESNENDSIDYQEIFRDVKFGPKKTANKIASAQHQGQLNWLEKVICG